MLHIVSTWSLLNPYQHTPNILAGNLPLSQSHSITLYWNDEDPLESQLLSEILVYPIKIIPKCLFI